MADLEERLGVDGGMPGLLAQIYTGLASGGARCVSV